MEQTILAEPPCARKKSTLETALNLAATGFKHCIPRPYVIIEFNERIKQ